MNRVFFLTPLVLAATAACAPAPNQIQAGQWEIVSELVRLDVPGATPEQMQMFSRGGAGQVGMKDTERRCLSDAEARSYVQDLRGAAPPTCRVTDETYAGGVMRSHVTCQGPNNQQVEMVLDGRFTNTTFNARVDMTVPNPLGANQGPMRRSVQLRGRRTGQCTPSAAPGLPLTPAPQGAPAPAPAPVPAPPPGNSAG